MRISIALCTYNGDKFLLEQLKSIESQTCQPDELVICDDRSTDKTLEILYSFKGNCPFPVRIYQNESNLGSTKNFEKAIRLCEGDIIALSDQDDVWKPEKLEKIVSAFEKNPDAGYVFSDAELVGEDLNPLGQQMWESVRFQGRIRKRFENGEQFLCLLQQHIVTGATMAFRSSLREMIIPFPTDIIWIHDAWIAIVASSVGMYGVPLSEPLILYRQHSYQQLGAPPVPKTSFGKILEQYNFFKNVKHTLSQILKNERNSHECLRERLISLKNNYKVNIDKEIDCLFQRNLHYVNRIQISSTSGTTKLRLIYEEAKSGRYKCFANSWLSVLRDLVM